MGSSTRVTEPFISYERRLEYANADGKGAKASTHLNIISPENEGYSLAIPEKVTVKPEISDIYSDNDHVVPFEILEKCLVDVSIFRQYYIFHKSKKKKKKQRQ